MEKSLEHLPNTSRNYLARPLAATKMINDKYTIYNVKTIWRVAATESSRWMANAEVTWLSEHNEQPLVRLEFSALKPPAYSSGSDLIAKPAGGLMR